MTEVQAHGKLIAPEAIPDDALVRCVRCGLIDPAKEGHTEAECIIALRTELARRTHATSVSAPSFRSVTGALRLRKLLLADSSPTSPAA